MMKKTLLTTAILFAHSVYADTQWQTIHTDHFNVHYQQENNQWARSAANELEIVRAKVLAQQNRGLDEVVDVVVFDPLNSPNGFALPTSTNPMMALFTTPPQSDTVVSNNSGWQQLLVLHEYIHLVHLAQPTRSHWRQELRGIWDLYDISYSNMPRWVSEGYATLLESKMTGRGRLFDNYSEAILTEFAQQGAFPSYGQLSNFDGGFMAGSMAYLVGARFLNWLEQTYSEQTLDAVWTRMQAIKKRDFDDAFSGVFGESASKLYRRFVAEYTYKAIAREQTETALNSELWLALNLYASNPMLSPNNEQLAIVERDKDGKTQLKLYSTQDNVKAAEEFNEQQNELLADDPNDIADSPPRVFKRQQKQLLNQINRAGIVNPQWLNNEVLYFGAFSTHDEGVNNRVADIFSWHTQTGEITQHTEYAGIRRFSMSHDGQTLYGERAKNGFSGLIKLDLHSGEITPLFEKSLEVVYDYPVLSPDNTQLAFLKTSFNQNWQLYIQDLQGGKAQQIPMPKGYQYLSQPSFSQDGQFVLFVAGLDSATDIYRYDLVTQQLHKLTQGQEAIANPLAMSDGSVLYLSINEEGPDVKQLSKSSRITLVTDFAKTNKAKQQFVYEHTLPAAQVYDAPIGEQQNYDVWQQNATLALGEQYHSSSALLINASVKGSDLLKQLDWQIGYSGDLHDNALKGAFAELKYNALAIKYTTRLFNYDLASDQQYQATLLNEFSAKGGYLNASYPLRFGEFKLTPELAYNYTDYKVKSAGGMSQQWLRAGLSQSWQYDRQTYAIGQTLSGRWYDGEQGNQNWQGYDLNASVFSRLYDVPLYMNYQQQQRDNQSLALGGFSSSLIAKNTHAEYVFAPELPFYSALAERYQGYGGGISFKEGMPWLYYQQHQIDDEVFGQSYGLKWQGPFSFGLGPAGLNDVNINFGLARVEGDSFEDELRGWLGFYYSL